MDNNNKQKESSVVVNAGTFVGSQYAQVVSVTVTDVDITLEFIYINPRNNKKGEVVSRITLPRIAGEHLAQVINKVVAEHKAKKQ